MDIEELEIERERRKWRVFDEEEQAAIRICWDNRARKYEQEVEEEWGYRAPSLIARSFLSQMFLNRQLPTISLNASSDFPINKEDNLVQYKLNSVVVSTIGYSKTYTLFVE